LGKIYSNKSRALIKAAALNRKSVFISSIDIEVIDLYINITTVYKSIHKAAIGINSDIKTILRREKDKKKLLNIKSINFLFS
jgi:hypothetical protein